VDGDSLAGWALEQSNQGEWVVDGGTLNGRGHVWATYEEGGNWQRAGAYRYVFRVAYLEGGLHVNVQSSQRGRYAVGLRNADGLLRINLFKESPWGTFTDLVPARDLDFEIANDPPGFQVEIRATEGYVELYVWDYTQKPVLQHRDDDPLPPGTVSFETLEDGIVQIDDLQVWGPAQEEGLPDLAIVDATWRLQEENDLLVLRARVENQGQAESGPSDVHVELLPLQIEDTVPLPGLAPGRSEDVFLRLEFPRELRGEAIELLYSVDPGQRVNETNERNNTVRLQGRTERREPTGLADLTIVDAEWRLPREDLLRLRVRVENEGEGESGESQIRAELLRPGIGEVVPLAPLGSGERRYVSVDLPFPRELYGQMMEIFIEVDPEQWVEESDEEDNSYTVRDRAEPWEPTEAPTRVSPTPTPRQGDVIGGVIPIVIVVVVVTVVVGGLIYALVRVLRPGPRPEPPKEPGEPGPPVVPLPPVRLLRIWLSEGETGAEGVLHDRTPLQAGSVYTLHLQAQPRGAQSEGPTAAPDAREEERLRVVLFSPEDDFAFVPERVYMSVPEQGPSTEIRYPIRAQRAGHLKLRACIYHGNVLVQTALLEADALEKRGRRRAEGRISRVTDYVASLDLRALGRLPQPILNIFTNRASGDSHWIGLFAAGADVPEELRSGLPHTLGAGELADAADKLRTSLAEIQGLGAYRLADGLSADRQHRVDRLAGDLVKLAKAGRTLYHKLFWARSDSGDRREALWQFERYLREPGIISVARCRSDVTTIPWAALYGRYLDSGAHVELCPVFKAQLLVGEDLLNDPAGCRAQADCPLPPEGEEDEDEGRTVCPFGFWGFLHQVEQPLQQVTPTPVDEVPPELSRERYEQTSVIEQARGAEVELAVAYDPRLKPAREHVDGLEGVARRGGARVRVEQERDRVLREMLRQGGYHLYYFYCHGDDKKGTVELRLGPKDQPGYLAAAHLNPGWWRNWLGKPQPLVVLNACESVAMVPERGGEFIGTFKSLGSAGVVGTEIEVFTELASDVGTRLVQSMLAGRSIGEAFLEMRLQLLRRCNPLGLAYTYHAPATLHLHTPGDCAWCRSHLRGGTAR
jgi:hypothetical protein